MSQTVVELYPHQSAQVDKVREALKRNRRVILCAPPGVGKTRMSKHILFKKLAQDLPKTSGRALFTVHRRGLVENAAGSFDESPQLRHGVIMAGCETSYGSKMQVASIDTLNHWWLTQEGYKGLTFDLIVFDECHAHATKLQTFLEAHDEKRQELGLNPAFVLGLSATPQGEGLSSIFSEIVPGPDAEWLTNEGFLKPFSYYAATKGDLGKLIRRGASFTNESNAKAMQNLSGDLVQDWQRYAEGRATVGFFANLAQAKEAQAMLKASGIRAEYVDAKTPDDERKVIFKCLNNGAIDYICNCGIIERGTDIPRIGCVQLCTAIGSVVRYRQMIGRGSRPHADISNCIILDHAENVARHGFFTDRIEWSLDNNLVYAQEMKERPAIECPNCGRVYRGGKCRECDYEPTYQERKKQGLEFNGEELKPVTKTKAKRAYSDERLLISALYQMRNKNASFRQVVKVAYARAAKEGQVFRCPKEISIGGRTYKTPRLNSSLRYESIVNLFPFLGR